MKLHTISINNLRRRKAKMAFLTIGLMVGIATIVTLVTLTASMSSDIGKKMDEFGANILIMPQSNDRECCRRATPSSLPGSRSL